MTTIEYKAESKEYVDSALFKKWLQMILDRPGMSYERIARESEGGGINPSTIKGALKNDRIALDTMDRIVMGQGFMLWELGY
jgi:hypothetical protein